MTVGDETIQEILRDHMNLGSEKPLSYLPINTIEKILHMSLEAYIGMAKARGYSSITFNSNQCCVGSGAVYLYSEASLQKMLDQHVYLLTAESFPVDAHGFIVAIARDWLPNDHPVASVIHRAFGDKWAMNQWPIPFHRSII